LDKYKASIILKGKLTDSFGVVIWEIATRKIPFENIINSGDIIFYVTQGRRETIPNNIPKKYAKFIEHCWNNDVSKRPQADEIIEDELEDIEELSNTSLSTLEFTSDYNEEKK